MESKVEEGSHQQPKGMEPTNCVEFSSILPPELITEILSRLPVKSLLKFRSVLKFWLALISSPEFINTHLSIYNKDQRHHRLMLGPVIELSDLNYPMKDKCKEGFSVGSINGLICVVHGLRLPIHLFLWNPSIRKYKKLPNSRHKFRYDDHIYGFGYDVVDIFVFMEFRLILTSKYIGKLHWITSAIYDNVRKRRGITSFSLADENWGKVEKPCYGGRSSFSELGGLGSDLSGFSHFQTIGVDVWVMKEYGLTVSWTKLCTITYPKLKRSLLFPSVFLSNNGDVLVVYESMFIIYNPKDDSFKCPK
ncbi:hypothetical protein H5410_052394, partial [Solanum commersonii]